MIVGKGMLDAACPGDVFAAPPMDYVYETAKKLATPKGVLLLVNNYTGDRMAFDMGKEMAEAEGVRTEILFIDDDVAVQGLDLHDRPPRRGRELLRHQGRRRRRRSAGDDLEEVVRIGKKVNDVTRTMGVGADRLHPARQGLAAVRARRRRDGGRCRHPRRAGPRAPQAGRPTTIVDELLDAVVTDLPYTSGDRVALMVNGLGGTPISELYIVYGRAHKQLADRGITVARSYVSEYCTSLDMAGASITLVKLDDEIEELLAAPAEMPIRVF